MGPSMYKQSVAISKFLIPLRRFVEIALSMISRPIWGNPWRQDTETRGDRKGLGYCGFAVIFISKYGTAVFRVQAGWAAILILRRGIIDEKKFCLAMICFLF